MFGILGWIAAILIAITTALAYFLRRHGSHPPTTQREPYLARLRLHYWLGYTILVTTGIHATISTTGRAANAGQSLGVVLAIGTLALLFWQLVLGLNLNGPTRNRQRLRRLHFRVMLGIVTLGLGHIVLNSALLRGLFQ